ncbi:MAG: SpoIIE family protein phosphatase [Bacilli bacterium]|nr:SpoIIE family protein phosphatase [Bacilli bacterium]
MKKRFPILAKIGILGALTSIIAAAISIVVTYNSAAKRSEEALISRVNNCLDSIYFQYYTSDEANELIVNLVTIKEKTEEVYEKVKDIHQSDYATFSEYEAAMKSKAPWFYPDPTSMIGSQEFLAFRQQYIQLNSLLTNAQFSSGAVSVFTAYFMEEKSSYVFMADSRYNVVQKGEFYFLVGSSYTLKSTDVLVEGDEESYDTFSLNGYLTRKVEVLTNDGEYVATFFIQYTYDAIRAENQRMLIRDALILFGTSLAIIGIIILGSYLMFTRNIKKVTDAASKAKERLSKNEEFEAVSISIKSNDEMRTLGESFNALEQQLVDYIAIVKKEAMEKERVNAELGVASKIQLDSLPSTSYYDEKVRVESLIRTAKEVGGDFYDYFYVGKKFVVIMSDVSGKGIPAALFMMKAKELLKSNLIKGSSLKEAATEVNEALVVNNKENLFVTSFIGMIDFEEGKLSYVNAGHEKPYLISNGEVIRLDGNSNFVLGGVEGIDFVEESVSFKKGDKLFMFTDGLNEAINSKEEEFTYENIQKTLEDTTGASLKDIISTMTKRLDEFVGEQEVFDDVTMMVVEPGVSLHLSYDKKDYSIIEDAVDKFNESFDDLSIEVKSKVGIILDELMNNLISYEKREDLVIDLDFILLDETLRILIRDNGDDYDVLANHKEKYANKGDDLEVGGFGIAIVKDLAKEVTYEYLAGHSVMKIIMDLK